MTVKKILKTILIIGLISILLSGCSNSVEKNDSQIIIETDESDSNENTQTSQNENINETIDDEFIEEDSVEIGELI